MNVNRAATLVGISMAIFIFILFFLYPQYQANQINRILFKLVLTVSVLAIFSFGFSALYYHTLLGVSAMSIEKRLAKLRRADHVYTLGLVFGVLEPALILFTDGLTDVGLIALGLCFAFTYSVFRLRGNLTTC